MATPTVPTPPTTPAKTSTAASLLGIASSIVPLLGSLLSKSPTTQTSQQQAQTLAAMPQELKDLLAIQTQNAKAGQPLYQNAIAATNRLLPAWARNGSVGMSGTTGTTQTGPTLPSPFSPADDTAKLSAPDFGGGAVGMPFNSDGTGGGLPGMSPQTILTILGLLTGATPVTETIKRAMQKGAPSVPTLDLR